MSRSTYRVNPEWEHLHREFHRSLLAGCGSKWLLSFCLQLSDHSYRYRQIAFRKAFPRRTAGDGHRAIMEAALGGNAEKAVRLLQEHLQFTARTILESSDALRIVFPKVTTPAPRARKPRSKRHQK
jgi:DNA-binding GntR family transcriptional regulator